MNTGYPSIDRPWLKYYKESDKNAEIPYMSALEYVKKQNVDRMELPAIDSVEGKYTYGEMFEMISRTASSLSALGVQKGQISLVLLPAISYEVFLFYGIDAVGGASSFLAPGVPTEILCDSIRKFNTKNFFVFGPFLTGELERTIYETTGLEHIICIEQNDPIDRDSRTISWESFLKLGAKVYFSGIERDPGQLLFIAKTGGTTGTPKEVMLNDNSFNILVHQYLHTELPYDAGDRWLRMWPIFSATAAVSSSHLALCAGMESVLRPLPADMSSFDQIILTEKPNHLILIPQLFDVFDKSPLFIGKDLGFIKTAGCGGLSITGTFEERVKNFFNRFSLPLFLGYGWGCTENSSSAAMRMNEATTKIGTVGIPLINTVVSAFDPETLVELPYGEEGELCIQSHTAMIGYYNDPKLTQTVLKHHKDGKIWIHTGDLGTVDKDGFVTIHGRMTRTFFVFSNSDSKIYPTTMENAIAEIPGVEEVAVIGIPDHEHEGFSLPICFVVKDENYPDESVRKDVEILCRNIFPEYARPREIYTRESFPLTKVGKVDYRALEDEAMQV